MKNEPTILTEARVEAICQAICDDEELVEEIRSAQLSEPMTKEEFFAWLDSHP